MQRKNHEALSQMTKQEKYEKTSYSSFLDRDNIISSGYDEEIKPMRYLTQNEYPYLEHEGKVIKDHKTLRIEKKHWDGDIDKRAKKTKLPEQGYIRFENPPELKSVPDRPHIHFLLLG